MTEFEDWFPNAPAELKIRPGLNGLNPPDDLTTCNALELWVLWFDAHTGGLLWHRVMAELRHRIGRSKALDEMEERAYTAMEAAGRLLEPPPGPTSPPKATP